jgi:hypothetical protein
MEKRKKKKDKEMEDKECVQKCVNLMKVINHA